MKRTLLVTGMLLLAQMGAQADTLYRWVDAAGKVHYGERPDPDASGVVQKSFARPNITDEELLPYETRRARQNFPVMLYVNERCGEPCTRARDFLSKRGIPYSEILLATDAEIDAFKKKSGGNGVPALTIGKLTLNGFEPSLWGSELDIAGYPKSAPYELRPVVPQLAPPRAESAVAPAAPAPAP